MGGITPLPGGGAEAQRGQQLAQGPSTELAGSESVLCIMVAHGSQGLPNHHHLRLLGSLTQFTDDKTEAKKKTRLVQGYKAKARGMAHPSPVPTGIWPEKICTCESLGQMWELREAGGGGPESLQGESSRATRPSIKPFPSGQTLEWVQELDRWGARPA